MKYISLLSLVLLFSCGNMEQRRDIVCINKAIMVIESSTKLGEGHFKYEYHVTDDSSVGWTLRCDELYKIGDTLILRKKINE